MITAIEVRNPTSKRFLVPFGCVCACARARVFG